jgi:hypothetical protein
MQPRRRPCRRCALAQPREHLTRLDCGSRPPREARQAPQLPTAPAPSRAFSTTLAMVRHARAQPRPVETPSLVRIPVAVLTVLVPRRVSCRQRHGATSERRVHRGPACRYLRLPHAVARPQRRSATACPAVGVESADGHAPRRSGERDRRLESGARLRAERFERSRHARRRAPPSAPPACRRSSSPTAVSRRRRCGCAAIVGGLARRAPGNAKRAVAAVAGAEPGVEQQLAGG